MHKRIYLLLCLVVVLLGMIQTTMRSAQAISLPPIFTVNSTADVPANPNDTDYTVCRTNIGNSTCTLRAAIDKANKFPGGGVLIHLPALPSPGKYTLTAGSIEISRTITMIGGGANGTIIDGSINGFDIFGIFHIVSGTVTMNSLTIEGGHAHAGAAIYQYNPYADTSVLLDSVVLRNNVAGGFGGAIYTNGHLDIRNSTIMSNTAPTGGGIRVSDNANVQIQNSTISNNHTTDEGGGLYVDGKVDLFNVTLVYNEADSDVNGNQYGDPVSSGAVYVYPSATFSARNSILAPNYGTYTVTNLILLAERDCSGVVNSTASSIIGPAIADCTYNGSWIHNAVTKLGVLKDNGGSTPTHALLPGSPALDAGEFPNCTDSLGTPIRHDQRGFGRPADGGNGTRCDIGAVEMQRLLFLPLLMR